MVNMEHSAPRFLSPRLTVICHLPLFGSDVSCLALVILASVQ